MSSIKSLINLYKEVKTPVKTDIFEMQSFTKPSIQLSCSRGLSFNPVTIMSLSGELLDEIYEVILRHGADKVTSEITNQKAKLEDELNFIQEELKRISNEQ